MGNIESTKKINFEDMQILIQNKQNIIINTLDIQHQDCLIVNTINYQSEESIINNLLNTNLNNPITIYGKNNNDENIYKKYQQLTKLGFTNIYLYIGGLFEWLCLQDIYGIEEFPTTKQELDILKFKPTKSLHGNTSSLYI